MNVHVHIKTNSRYKFKLYVRVCMECTYMSVVCAYKCECICTCVYVFVCVHVCMYVCIYIYICVFVYVCVCIFICVCVCMSVSVCVCVCVCVHTLAYTYCMPLTHSCQSGPRARTVMEQKVNHHTTLYWTPLQLTSPTSSTSSNQSRQ